VHCQIARLGRDHRPISLGEWKEAASRYANFVITDELKQQNPFTQKLLMVKVPGSGYWEPLSGNHVGWPHDGLVWFRHTGKAVNFIQYSDVENPELRQLANDLDGTVVYLRIST
jgi:hypothetical protein